MRLLHPTTLEKIANTPDSTFEKSTVSRKQVISHAWCEVLKFLATEQEHPKMFINRKELIGVYLAWVKKYGDQVGCNLEVSNLMKYDDVCYGFANVDNYILHYDTLEHFDDMYLFSDCISLYFKGVNIMPEIYGDDWLKYVPIQNLKEVYRVVGKTLGKEIE